MSAAGRVRAETKAGWYAFVRRRTAVFFTFFFPAILIVIFGALVRTGPGGLFAEPPAYYVPGYLAVVVLFTPLSRISSTVARYREGRNFEKLATTPLSPAEWLLAHSIVNAALVGIACVLVIVLVLALTGARFALSPLLVPFVAIGTVLFCAIGGLLGRLADSRDGAIAASNAVGLPLLFLSETFVPAALLPAWFRPLIALSPLTYFARGVRAAIGGSNQPLLREVALAGAWPNLAILCLLGAVAFVAAATAIPWRS